MNLVLVVLIKAKSYHGAKQFKRGFMALSCKLISKLGFKTISMAKHEAKLEPKYLKKAHDNVESIELYPLLWINGLISISIAGNILMVCCIEFSRLKAILLFVCRKNFRV